MVASSCQAASVSDAQITDRIYMDIKGVALDQPPQRIVIGLFGKDAPEAVQMLKSLVTKEGLAADCKPKEIRALQKEQLEVSKVYNACVEGQGQGVNYDLSTIWRVIKDERIDVGAVQGRFVARQFPSWNDENILKHDAPGVVSVRKGNDSAFGFTIYPGGGGDASYLDSKHVVVGRVVEGMNVVESINQVPVVTSKFASRAELPAAPSRACRYGGNQLYCSEYKPLTKLSIVSTGVL
jgi:cyclophilin family peptidyl-prolyl cis-trans isomerase